jgi:hypothetical protein
LSGSLEAAPVRLTVSPSLTDWAGPASATGGVSPPVIVTVAELCQLSF